MKDVESVAAGLSFDDLLSAVNESSRGRWFLDEYQKRLRKAESGDILSAINRIEARIASFAPTGLPGNEMQAMKAALNAARTDIAKLAPAKNLSDEGRLFANLAELARKTMAAETSTAEIAPGIVKALQLVDTLDTTLNGPAKGDQFFRQDSALFEPAPSVQKPVLVSSQTKPEAAATSTPVNTAVPDTRPVAIKADVDVPGQGAKLVIVKAGQKVEAAAPVSLAAETTAPDLPKPEKPTDDVPVVAVVETNPTIIEAKQVMAMAEPKMDNPRIVIIRRKPEEMTEVPLADEAKTETAA